MRIGIKKRKTSLTLLNQTLSSIEKTKIYFLAYLNSGDKNYWEDMLSSKHFQFDYCSIIDKDLMPKNYFPQLRYLIDKHSELRDAIVSKKEEAFTLLAYFQLETKKMFFSELKRHQINLDINSEDFESKIKEIIEYEEGCDPKTAVEDFKNHLRLKE